MKGTVALTNPQIRCYNGSHADTHESIADAGTLRELKEEPGLSLRHLMIEVCELLPRNMWISYETIRNRETDAISEDKANPIILTVLA